MKKLLVAFPALLLLTLNAGATVLSFDGAGAVENRYADPYTGIGDTYVQSGFELTVGEGQHFDSFDSNGINFHDGPANAYNDNWATLTMASGGRFDLSSFYLAFNGADFMTNLSNGVTTFGAGAHAVSLTGVTWVAFSGIGNSGNYVYLDNVVVNAAVPEPSLADLLD